jgi:hypothetical protein
MTGTILNIATVVLGGIIGTLLGARLSGKLRQTVVSGLGLFTLAYGIRLFIETQNPLVIVGSLLVGALLGEWWKIENGLQSLGGWLEQRFIKNNGGGGGRFVRGFFTASLVFCIGPMTILGSIQDGLTGDYNTLAIKAILDGFAALAFASSLGVGVVFSAFVILVYQGGISLLASTVNTLITPVMMDEMSAVGGVMMISIAVSNLLELKPIRTGNFLPALIVAPLLTALFIFLNLY